MNFFDYELTRTSANTPPQTATASNEPEISLNEEVSQVVGQLGKLWGGFRKQSQVALETARRDLTSVVTQAQKEFDKLTRDPAAASSAEAAGQNPVAGPSSSHEQALRTDSDPPEAQISEKSDSDSGLEPSSLQQQPSQATPFQAFFSRVQSSLPPNLNNLSETFERTLPTAFKDSAGHLHMPSAADLAQLRSEFGARVQDALTRAQAEQYVQRSEALLRDAGEYLREAVKVVPPEEGSGDDGGEADVVFDGMGVGVVVMPPKMVNKNSLSAKAKGKGKETTSQARIISRASAMLARLRQDPEVLKQDPVEDEETRDMYEKWLRDGITAKGSMDSSYWSERIRTSMKEDGEQLTSTRNALVPFSMDSDTFWTRYFFRIYQIEKDEEKRKLLLAVSGAPENDEEFTWEDDGDEEDSGSSSIAHSGETATKSRAPTESPQPGTPLSNDDDGRDQGKQRPARASPEASRPQIQSSYPSSLVTSPSNASPRVSSDEYDVISATSIGDTKAKAPNDMAKIDESNRVQKDEAEDVKEDEDSDWE